MMRITRVRGEDESSFVQDVKMESGLGHPHSARRLASQLSNFSFHELTASISPDTDTAEVQRALATATLCVLYRAL